MPLMSNEVAVIMTGGTPESIVGAMCAGYRTILYIASDQNETQMMMLPSEVEEKTNMVDYSEYFCCNGFLQHSKEMQVVVAVYVIMIPISFSAVCECSTNIFLCCIHKDL
jgi:hypothetical protein